MKKIISMGIASAVLALTAIAASADIKANGPEKVVNGKSIKVEITTTAAVTDCGFVVSATGLEVESVDTTVDGATVLNSTLADGSLKIGGFSNTADPMKAGTVLATITYTVTAATGEDVAVAIDTASQGYDDVPVNYTATVVAEETSEPEQPTDPSDPGKEDPTDPGKEDPTDPGDVPATGVALAVVPAVLAGAAVVVAKKRK